MQPVKVDVRAEKAPVIRFGWDQALIPNSTAILGMTANNPTQVETTPFHETTRLATGGNSDALALTDKAACHSGADQVKQS